MHNGTVVPAIGIFRLCVWRISALTLVVGSRGKYFILFQLSGNLARSAAFHTHIKDTLYHFSSFRINNPVLRIIRILHIPVRYIGCQRKSFFSLCFLNSSDLAAGISGIEFIKPVFDTCHVALGAVHVDGIEVVIDGDISNTAFRKYDVDIQAGHRRVSSKS